jgi:hypothetical protein
MLGGMVNRVAALVAEVCVIDPELAGELRQTVRRIVTLVRALEAELRRFAELEVRLIRAIRQVEVKSGQEVDDGLFERVVGWLGVLRVRPALDRLEQAYPDALEDSNAP